MVLRKDQIEASLLEESKLIQDGKLKEDNPLDTSEPFRKLCEACRRGDLKVCQETITEGANINARDQFDYTPLILASLCGHFEVVQVLLESGALCERDTFQGERCLYNALNDRIRNLLLSYDYSKSADPLQPFASHISSLLAREHPQTADILVTGVGERFRLHKFVLSARSPYFYRKLSLTPETASWKLPPAIPPQAFSIAMKYLYLGEIPTDVGGGPGTGYSEDDILEGIDKISKQLEVKSLWDDVLEGGDRRLARQRRTDEVEKGRDQLDAWFKNNVLKHKVVVHTSKAETVMWDRQNGIFADVLLRADEAEDEVGSSGNATEDDPPTSHGALGALNGIPIGPSSQPLQYSSHSRIARKSTLFPAHRAMLLRSEFFMAMFSSGFREAQDTEHLQIIFIDCTPDVLEVVLTFLYTEKTNFPLDIAIDVLFAADLLLMEKLKLKAANVVSTLGNGSMAQISDRSDTLDRSSVEQEDLDICDVVRAGWLTRVPRLEEFGARFIAYRLEDYIGRDDFAQLVRESASRIKGRQETDTIELLDDIRYYLSERFRLRFEDSGLDDLMEEDSEQLAAVEQEHGATEKHSEDEGVDLGFESIENTRVTSEDVQIENFMGKATIRTLDGEIAGDELEGDAINYQILLGKIDDLLSRLKLEA